MTEFNDRAFAVGNCSNSQEKIKKRNNSQFTENYVYSTAAIKQKYDLVFQGKDFGPLKTDAEYYDFEGSKVTKLGGGASGAYVFKCERPGKKPSVYKVYFTALEMVNEQNPFFLMRDDRPFRECRSLEILSRYMSEHRESLKPGCFTRLVSPPAIIKFEKIKDWFVFGKGQISVYDPNFDDISKKRDKKLDTKNEARQFNEDEFFPTHVLLVEMEFAGPSTCVTELHNIHVSDPAYGGAVLQLLSVYFDHFQRCFPKGCHWDLHTDNIFVDRGTLIRHQTSFTLQNDSLQLSEDENTNLRENLRAFSSNNPKIVNIPLEMARKRSGFADQTEIENNPNDELLVQKWMDKIKNFSSGNAQNKKNVIKYPAVTIIDFDYVTCDENFMKKTTPDHMQKINLSGGLSERTLEWLLRQMPRSSVLATIRFLEQLKPALPEHNAGDWCHILAYICAFVSYSIASVWGKAVDFITDEFFEKVMNLEKWDVKSLLELINPSSYNVSGIMNLSQAYYSGLSLTGKRHFTLDQDKRDSIRIIERSMNMPLVEILQILNRFQQNLTSTDLTTPAKNLQQMLLKLFGLPEYISYENVIIEINLNQKISETVTPKKLIQKIIEENVPYLSSIGSFLDVARECNIEVNIKNITFSVKGKVVKIKINPLAEKPLFKLSYGSLSLEIKKILVTGGSTPTNVMVFFGNLSGESIKATIAAFVGRAASQYSGYSVSEKVWSFVLAEEESTVPLLSAFQGKVDGFLDDYSNFSNICFDELKKYVEFRSDNFVNDLNELIANAEIKLSTTKTDSPISITLLEKYSETSPRVSKVSLKEFFGYLSTVGFKMAEVLPIIYLNGYSGTSPTIKKENAKKLKRVLETYSSRVFPSEKYGAYMDMDTSAKEIFDVSEKVFSISKVKMKRMLQSNFDYNYGLCCSCFLPNRPKVDTKVSTEPCKEADVFELDEGDELSQGNFPFF